jgi:uncharacterized membrane protein
MLQRTWNFTDGVFAFALTLLVLELRIPEGVTAGDKALWAALAANLPHFASVLLSFWLIGGWWLHHQSVVKSLARFDWPTITINLVQVLFIMLMPFAAGFFGEYPKSGAALAVYWGVNAGASLASTALFFVMTRKQGMLLDEPMSAAAWWNRSSRLLVLFACCALGVAFAVRGPFWLSGLCWIPFSIYTPLAGLFFRKPAAAVAQ